MGEKGMKTTLILAATALMLAACTTMPEDPNGPLPVDPDEQMCAANSFQGLVGQPIGEVDIDSLPQPTRVVPYDTAVTMEYRSERMTVWLDRVGRVERVVCG